MRDPARPLMLAGLVAGLVMPLPSPGASPRPVKVVTSFFPVYCLVAKVAGTGAEVVNLLPARVGPHDYQLAPQDLRTLAAADLLIVNGLGLEDWLLPHFKAVGSGKEGRVVEIAAGLRQELIFQDAASGRNEVAPQAGSHNPGAKPNPHVWLDPRLMAHGVTNVLRALQAGDPARADLYAHNAAACVASLEKLDAELREGLAPLRRRSFITYHDAFPYFIRRYGLDLAGVVETTPDVAPAPRHLSALLRVAREKRARVIFVEPQFSSQLARSLGRDLGIPVAELDPLESGPLVPAAYEAGLRRNLAVLQKQLQP